MIRIAGFIALLVLWSGQVQGISITERTVIVLPEKPSPLETHAAEELRQYLQRITGVLLPVRQNAGAGAVEGIFIGNSPAASAIAGCDFAALPTDAIVLKSSGDDLVLAGGAPRGTLYAVYEFLEQCCGVRWWTSSETDVPVRALPLTLPELDVRHHPQIVNRSVFYDDVIRHPEFASHLRSNGHHNDFGPDLGGHYEIIGFCHTFEPFLPRSAYIAEHPGWYEMFNGVRDPDPKIYGQLCVTNPELRQALAGAVLQQLRLASDPTVISVSQNDTQRYCSCPECAHLSEAEGSYAAPLLLAVNEVADAVAKEFPQVQVETLAYQYTRKAPKTSVPRDNVIIRLCSIECDFSRPMNSDANAAFRDDLLEWARIAPELAIWHYTANFSNYLAPQPNLTHLADDIRFYAANRVSSLFLQGDYQSGADFSALRAWVAAKLMWNPALDQQQLMDEFLTGYYGAEAAPKLRAYFDLLETQCAAAGVHLGCFRADTRDWLSLDTLARIHDIWAGMPRTSRLERAMAGYRSVLVERFLGAPEEREAVRRMLQLPPEITASQYVEDYIRFIDSLGMEYFREGQDFAAHAAELRQRAAELDAH